MKAAAATVDEEETAEFLGRAYGTVLGLARAEAERRGCETMMGPPRWVDTMLEVVSGGLHTFFDRAQAFARRQGVGVIGRAFWQAFVAAQEEGTWVPLRLLSEAQKSAGARLEAMPWVLRKAPLQPVGGAAPDGPLLGRQAHPGGRCAARRTSERPRG